MGMLMHHTWLKQQEEQKNTNVRVSEPKVEEAKEEKVVPAEPVKRAGRPKTKK